VNGHVLPASVRVALRGTAALAGRVPLAEVRDRALPDLDACTGLLEQLGLWRDLGERGRAPQRHPDAGGQDVTAHPSWPGRSGARPSRTAR
jgi:hypothetical protein